jgi:tRNA(Ile)-lysidine synthase
LYLEKFKATSIERKEDAEWINLSGLKQHRHPQVLLWELLKVKGFTYEQCEEAVRTPQPGKQFFSQTYRLLVDRDSLILKERNQEKISDVFIEPHQTRVSNNSIDLIVSKNSSGNLPIIKNPAVALMDAAKISFPLVWRKWQPGDFFKPLGMTTNKKLSDFLIDAKIPTTEKEKVTVIESAGMIVWVVGMRISEDVKLIPSTTASVVLEVVKTGSEKIS